MKSIENFLESLGRKYNRPKGKPQPQSKLALDLVVALENSDDALVKEAEYLLFDQKYGIGK